MQRGDDLVPARAIGECAVHQHDGRLLSGPRSLGGRHDAERGAPHRYDEGEQFEHRFHDKLLEVDAGICRRWKGAGRPESAKVSRRVRHRQAAGLWVSALHRQARETL